LSISSMKTMPFCSRFCSACGADLVLVDQLAGLFVDQQLHGLADLHAAQLAAAGAEVAQHALELLGHFLHAGRAHDLHGGRGLRQLQLDLLVVQLAFAQLLAEVLARGAVAARRCAAVGVAGGRDQHVEDAVLGQVLGARAVRLHGLLALLLDGHLGQVADDGIDVLADVAHLGELGGLDLDERRVRQPRQAARDLGLADAGGADHQDVLGRDLGRSFSSTCWRRQRLRSAMATARLASCWPTMWRSSSETISCGVMEDMANLHVFVE
jgi:hypothetical protein